MLPILIVAVLWLVVANVVWFKATKHLTEVGQARYWRIFLRWGWTGRREYWTETGWKYRRLAQLVSWTGFLLIATWMVFRIRAGHA
jgi:hypothetical protein